MYFRFHSRASIRVAAGLCLALVLALGAFGQGFGSSSSLAVLPGDLNRDGLLDVRDVQVLVNAALAGGALPASAGWNDTGHVGSPDIALLAQSALGEGGLLLPVQGDLQLPDPALAAWLRVEAVSTDGLRVEAAVSSVGRFALPLWGGRGWALAVVDTRTGHLAASFSFLCGGKPSLTLPVLPRCAPHPLNLGRLSLSAQAPVLLSRDIAQWVAAMAVDHPSEAVDENGLPHYANVLLAPVFRAVDPALDLPGRVAPCLSEKAATPVSLTDADGDGAPDFLQTALDCAREALADAEGEGAAHAALAQAEAAIPELMKQWPDLALRDANGNGIPDAVEAYLVRGDEPMPLLAEAMGDSDGDGTMNGIDPNWLTDRPLFKGWPWTVDADNDGVPDPADWDANGDGFPNFLDDADGDGVVNLVETSIDGGWDEAHDGIPRGIDRDCDKDGLPDYADPEPLRSRLTGSFAAQPLQPLAAPLEWKP